MLEIVEGEAVGSTGAPRLGLPARGAGQRGLDWRDKLIIAGLTEEKVRASAAYDLRTHDAGGMLPTDPS